MDAKSNEMQDLTELTGRVTSLELQFVQFRDEVRAEFSATREDLRSEIQRGDDRVTQTLREELRAGDEETRRLMRILHEDLVERIRLISRG